MDKRTTNLELFFDLVFVFAITQVASLVRSDLTVGGFARGALVLAMLWWGWGQFTWAANAIDLEPRGVRLGVLANMGPALIMAQAVPTSFGDGGVWLAASYAGLRAVALWKYWAGTSGDAMLRHALGNFIRWSSLGPVVFILGGLVDDPLRTWVWVGGVVAELVGAAAAGKTPWRVAPAHFAERHSLIIIVALGESIVAIGAGVAGDPPSLKLGTLLLVALAGSATLWWAYFDWLQEHWEEALVGAGEHVGRMARDVYSLLHYPMLFGVVLYAVAGEEAVAHPTEALTPGGRAALALALALYLLGQVAATYRASRRLLVDRIAAAAVAVAFTLIAAELIAAWVLAISTGVVLAALGYEHRNRRGRVASPR